MNDQSDELQHLRDRLVDWLARAGHIPDERVAAALRAVPRHAFLPEVDPELAYRDEAHVTARTPDGHPLSSSSQPAIMAVMLGQLALEPGHRVLEIGAGTGYNAALMAQLVGDRGSVTTVEIDPDLTERAHTRLTAIGLSHVTVVCSDGAFGWPERAPYERIIVTAATGDLAPAWQQQLADRGRLVVPLRLRVVQRSIAFERADGHLAGVSVRDCGFMALRGILAEPDRFHPLGRDTGLLLELGEPRAVDRESLFNAFAGPSEQVATGIRATVGDVIAGLSLWLALREPRIARLEFLGAPTPDGLLPPLIAVDGQVWAWALVGERALAVLVRSYDTAGAGASDRFEISVRGLGPGGRELAHRLAAHVREWHTRGRPATDALKICAAPASSAMSAGDAAIDKPHTRIIVDWQRCAPRST